MKKINMLVALIFILSISITAFAGEAIIVDKKDVKVELTSIKTKKVRIDFENFENLDIAVAAISSIRLAEDRKKLIIQSITGSIVKGISNSTLEGEWELGNYSVSLSGIKSIEFNWGAQKEKSALVDQPDGFCAVITDWSGKTMEVFNFKYWGRWYQSSQFIGHSGMRDETRKYIPINYKDIIVGVPFTDIDTINFTDNEATFKEWEPSLDIKLVDGTALAGKLARLGEYAPKFTGEVLQGGLVGRIQQITFNHVRDKNAPRVVNVDEFHGDLDSVYKISLKTLQGNQISLRNGCLIDLDHGYAWTGKRTTFKIKLGESTTDVDFSKIKTIQLLGASKAKLTTTSGKTIDTMLPKYNEIWIGGNFDRFGSARIQLSKVSSLEISKAVK